MDHGVRSRDYIGSIKRGLYMESQCRSLSGCVELSLVKKG